MILYLLESSFASLFGLILKPINFASDALAKFTSVSVTGPTADNIIFGETPLISIFVIEFISASREPWTSAFMIIFIFSAFSWLSKILSLLALWLFWIFFCWFSLYSIISFIWFSLLRTTKSSPALLTEFKPITSTGVDGLASFILSPL